MKERNLKKLKPLDSRACSFPHTTRLLSSSTMDDAQPLRRVTADPAASSSSSADDPFLSDMAQAMASISLSPSPPSSTSASAQDASLAAISAQESLRAAGLAARFQDNLEFRSGSPLSPAPRAQDVGTPASAPPVRARSQTKSRPRSRPQERPAVQDVSAMFSGGDLRRLSRKNLSRRKERRWANDHRAAAGLVFEEPGSSAPHGNLSAYFPDLEEFDVTKASRLIFEQEYISVFEGFTDEMRKAFLNCEGGFVRGGAPAPSGARRVRKQERTAEAMFGRIDKNLKTHLITRGRRPPFAKFLEELEEFLLKVIEDPSAHDLEKMLSPVLRKSLVENIRVCKDSESKTGNRIAVELVFKTGLHRLLTHGLCQFHGFTSKSTTSASSGLRVLRISQPIVDPSMLGWTAVEQKGRSAEPQDSQSTVASPQPSSPAAEATVDVSAGLRSTSSTPAATEDLLFGERVMRLVPFLQTLPENP